jgi:hypothetical protein
MTRAEVLTARELQRQLQRQTQLRCAVAVLAKQRARKIVMAMVRAKGERISDYTNRDLSMMAEQYMTQHWEELLPRARALAEEILTKRR